MVGDKSFFSSPPTAAPKRPEARALTQGAQAHRNRMELAGITLIAVAIGVIVLFGMWVGGVFSNADPVASAKKRELAQRYEADTLRCAGEAALSPPSASAEGTFTQCMIVAGHDYHRASAAAKSIIRKYQRTLR